MSRDSEEAATATPARIRVVIVEDHDMVSEAIALALNQTNDIEVVGQAGSLEQAAVQVRTRRPDVVILDRRLPDGDAIASIEQLQSLNRARVLVLTGEANPAVAARVAEAGGAGLVLKSSRLDELTAAVRAVANGEPVFDAGLLATVLARLTGRLPPAGAELTARESETLQLLAEGASTEQISDRLGIARNTTRNHIQRLMAKLGARSKLEAVALARRYGLID
jgi:DNA-binding NarL/FixJ family response regulator